MANIEVKLRRGTEAEHDTTSGGFTGAEGEVTVDTTNDTLRVHDGSTVGGVRLAKLSEVSAGGGGTVTSVGTGAGLSGGPITTSGTLSLATIQNMSVLGNTAGYSTVPVPVPILDEDDMVSDSDTELATQQSIKAYVDARVTASTISTYESGETTLPNANATETWAHGLGQTPDIIKLILKCTSSEYGYSVDDEVHFTSEHTVNVSASSFWADSSNVYLRYKIDTGASAFWIVRRDTNNVSTPLTPSNWRIIVRAFVF